MYQRTKEVGKLAVKAVKSGNRTTHRDQNRQYKRTVPTHVRKTTDAFIEIDETGKVIGWNPSAERIFGWSRMKRSWRNLLIS